ncbi:MAG: SDR family NAD(P)-dependent oxidoreductase [Alphaproteobacteria bacterium]|nr:SDR family NAD(P)-dependent oxidoreductase [Alphaproteobacteria bacterium]
MTLTGKRIVVTGATDGIGLQAAIELARLGARLHLVGRNPEKLSAAADKVAAASGGAPPVTYLADLSSQVAVRSLAAEIAAQAPELDVLLNNAGGIFLERQVSADGIEMTFALDHLNYFLLTHLLLDRLKAAPRGRIVNVASAAHRGSRLDFDDLQGERRYSAWGAYGKAKLANIMFTYALARRLEGSTVTANCLHPGFVASNFGGDARGLMGIAFSLAKRVGALRVTDGAKTPVYLCGSAEVEGVSGKYFDRCKAVSSSAASMDKAAQERLWGVSERLTGISP